jgi:hypothetical protein
MFTVDVYSDLGVVREYIADVIKTAGEVDWEWLKPRLEEKIRSEHMRMAQAGTGVDGRPLEPITPETRDIWRPKEGKGTGPPLSPDDFLSRRSYGLEVDAKSQGKGQIEIVLEWPNAPFLTHHAKGIQYPSGFKKRDVLGLDERALMAVAELITQAARRRYEQGEAANAGIRPKRGLARRAFDRLFGGMLGRK